MAMHGVLFVICIPSVEQEKRLQSGDISLCESFDGSKQVSSIESINDKDMEFSDTTNANNSFHKPRLGRCSSEFCANEFTSNKQTIFLNKTIIDDFRNKCEDMQPKKTKDILKESEKLSMEKKLEKCLLDLNITNAVWSTDRSKKYYQVSFCIASGDPCEELLQVLSELQIGLELDSAVSVIPCSLHYEGNIKRCSQKKPGSAVNSPHQKSLVGLREVTGWERFVHSMRARLTVAEVIAGFKANAFLTFDFVVLLFIAAIIAALGLVENSTVILVASMLISPLMGPIMAGTFGFMIKDRNLLTLGIKNELFGLLLCVVIGYAFGIVVGLVNIQWGNGLWPTEEMRYKGEVESLFVGAFVALPSGAAVAIAILGDNTGSLIGVAISLSLMPPAVNAGLLWALATTTQLKGASSKNPFTNLATQDHVSELTQLGAISLCLTFVNIVCIFVSSIIVFKIKEVTPRGLNDYSKHFWKETFKIARKYKHINDEDLNLSRRLVEEMENQTATRDDLHDINLFKHHPNIRKMNQYQYTWSPCSSNPYPRPSAQELNSLLHSRPWMPGASSWQTEPPSPQLPSILEDRRFSVQQSSLPYFCGRRFFVTPATEP